MFERIVLRRSVDGPAISAGEIAEALFFYQNVHIVLDWSSFRGLGAAIGMPTFLAMLARPDVTATYVDDDIATHTEHTSTGDVHSVIAYRFAGDKESGELKSKKQRLEYTLSRMGYDKRQTRRYYERFRNAVKFRRSNDDFFIEGGLIKAANRDLVDNDYIDAAARVVTQNLLRGEALPAGFNFRILQDKGKFRVSTNADFERITAIQSAQDPNFGNATPALIAQAIVSASVGTVLAGHYGGDFYTSNVESRIIRIRHDHLLRRAGMDQGEIRSFNKIAIDNAPTIAEVINNGDRTFDEFLAFLKKSKKFKEWLRGRSPDERLIAAYIEDATSESWLNKIPAKSVRYLLGTAVSMVDDITGHAFSIGDAFLLDKLLGGWRANQFVNKHLQDFLSVDEE